MKGLFTNSRWDKIRRNMGLEPFKYKSISLLAEREEPKSNESYSKFSRKEIKQKLAKVKDFIVRDLIHEAIDQLLELSLGRNEKNENELLLLKSRHKSNNVGYRKGLISREDHNIELNRIRDAILEICNSDINK